MFVCVCLSSCVPHNSKDKGSSNLKLDHVVVYENSLDEFNIRHCSIKVKVTLHPNFIRHPYTQM